MSLALKTEHQRLSGQVALITGAGRGLGQSVAIAYAGQGASGITGERISAFELSERIRAEGWNLSAKNLVFSEKGCSKY